ncbi:hypothetical protein K2173_026749 [Erythroxylum novogranatense]|uniref:Cytochrome P450 n=1 Tax=Erythroxylum novogranatense TaxID=1862640 RepID=A0AAV8TXC0_9ROSI|nr:hypothetical protein K2173_026749 [Erythroxylum novogranatense]
MEQLQLSPFAAIVTVILLLLATIFVYSCFVAAKKKYKKKLPPEVTGGWPVIGHLPLLAVESEPSHVTLEKLAEKFGPIFTIKLGVYRTLIVSNWEMAKECLTVNDRAFATRPRTLAMEILGNNYSMLGFSPYGSYWRQMRKIVIVELLSNHRLKMLQHVRESELKAAAEGLYLKWTKSASGSNKVLVDMQKWFWDVALNMILKITVGKRYVEYTCCSDDEQKGGWRKELRLFMELSGKFSASDSLPFLRWMDLGGVERAMKKCSKNLEIVAREWLEEHKQKKASIVAKSREDFMDVLLSILDDAKDLSSRDADSVNISTCLALIIAASDTTAVTLTWTLALLLNNRDALNKVQHELDIHVGKDRQVKESDMHNLVYLEAVIKESLRLYPAVPLLPHESMEDCNVGGYQIPAGTRLFINAWKIHRDPQVWSDPHEFKPERFLTTHKDVDVRGQSFELIPFGSGRRMCPGISFALQVLNLTLATLLHGFEIEAPSNKPIDMRGGPGLSNIKLTPLEVFLGPRLPQH